MQLSQSIIVARLKITKGDHVTFQAKGQLNSESIYEVIVSPKMQTQNYQTNKDRNQKNCLHSPKNHQKKSYGPCL